MPEKRKETTKSPVGAPMWVTWEEGDAQGRALAMYNAGTAIKRNEPIVRSVGSDVFFNVAPNNVSVRDGFNRGDFDSFRHEQMLPTKPKDIIQGCMAAYRGIGIVRNVIDLMADFASQGVGLVHPNERIETWFQEWFRRVNGRDRSERFLNLLYRTANVVVKRATAMLPVRVEEEMKRSAGADMDIEPQAKFKKREIPWKYSFLNPLTLDVLADELTTFVGADEFTYAVKITKTLSHKIKNPKTPTEKALVAKLPSDIRLAVQSGAGMVPLDPTRVKGFWYKRDDWQVWAEPMLYAILPDLQVLQKMKLADLAALDGAISCIRVWKLGNIEARILPTAAAIDRLAEMLCNNVGGGVMDLVWGPEIDLLETKTDVHHFLGNTKYEPTLTAIYAGLGIPPTLTGAATSGGFTNNFISLQTLCERLEYGRGILRTFWEEEIRLVQQAMGFRFPAKLVFGNMKLSDEAAQRQLLLHLWDRGLVSDETIQAHFDEVPDIEEVRLRRDARKRKNGSKQPKAGPFTNAEKDHDYKKIFATQGTVTPSELGVELEENDGEKTLLDQQNDMAVKQAKLQQQSQQSQNDHQYRTEKLQLKHGVHPLQTETPKGQPGQGRPKNAKDSQQRKQKQVKPRTSAAFFQTFAWAENAQARIGQIASPAYLKALGKKTLRELTDEEAAKFESYKFYLLCQLEPNAAVDDKAVASLSAGKLAVPEHVHVLLKATVAKHAEVNGKEPTMDVLRRFQAGAYAFWKGDFSEEDE